MTEHTNFSARLDDLQQHLARAKEAVQTAAETESEERLTKRIE